LHYGCGSKVWLRRRGRCGGFFTLLNLAPTH
jgi:hypothetical protein